LSNYQRAESTSKLPIVLPFVDWSLATLSAQ